MHARHVTPVPRTDTTNADQQNLRGSDLVERGRAHARDDAVVTRHFPSREQSRRKAPECTPEHRSRRGSPSLRGVDPPVAMNDVVREEIEALEGIYGTDVQRLPAVRDASSACCHARTLGVEPSC